MSHNTVRKTPDHRVQGGGGRHHVHRGGGRHHVQRGGGRHQLLHEGLCSSADTLL